jgi:hypothetical protein
MNFHVSHNDPRVLAHGREVVDLLGFGARGTASLTRYGSPLFADVNGAGPGRPHALDIVCIRLHFLLNQCVHVGQS